MNKKMFLLLASLVGAAQSYGVSGTSCYYSETGREMFGFESDLTVAVGGGYRQDEIQWTIFPDLDPGTKVKEKWSGLHTGIVEVGVELLACENFLAIADFDYGWFDDNGTQSIKTESTGIDRLLGDVHSETKGRVYDVSGALGYQFNWCCSRYSFAPLAGYSYHHQKLVNKEYERPHSHELGCFLEHSHHSHSHHHSGCHNHHSHHNSHPSHHSHSREIKAHNTYNSHWSGPLLGFSSSYQISCDWQIAMCYAYHWARFHNTVKEHFPWCAHSLVPDGPQQGKQISDWGFGNEITFWTSYEFAADWIFAINLNFKEFKANKGKFKQQVEFEHDNDDDDDNEKHFPSFHEISSPLRGVKWISWNICCDVAYVF